MKERLITKSLFVRALTCPAKLFYAGKPEYADNSLDNEFLEALAKGGIQVGALARCYFPDGILISEPGNEAALAKTTELLRKDRVVLFEAAIRHGPCYIRADILIKDGTNLDLIEVKAKSCDFDTSAGFIQARGGIDKGWLPYLYDVAFQKHVLQQAYPRSTVRASLMLADKRKKASVDGLNQRFILQETNSRFRVDLHGDCSMAGLGEPILVKVLVDDVLSLITDGKREELDGKPFANYVAWLAENFRADRKISQPVGLQCQACEFKPTTEQRQNGVKSGYCECWGEQWGLTEAQLDQPNIFDIWNYRGKAKLLEQRRFFLTDVTEDDIVGGKTGEKAGSGLSPAERQWIQIEKAQKGDPTIYFDRAGFAEELASWRFPLHFIDFETSAVAIPFNAGRRPYEGIAFQFSHHVVQKDGQIEHVGQWLDVTPGIFPNYEFVRRLKSQLGKDDGTIFRYAPHENSYLNTILRQLQEEPSGKVPDRDELIAWIKTITHSTGGSATEWEGPRDMVDLWELEKRFYYNPLTRGSNSIKYVLPAVLNSSPYLQAKYSKPIYGAVGGILSLNYKDWAWVTRDVDGKVVDPYKLLPPVFQGISADQLEYAEKNVEGLADGAAAMMAYARLQFIQPEADRESLASALLRYCELDTMAMVMIWEHWVNLLGKGAV
jgi:hypothetical protein